MPRSVPDSTRQSSTSQCSFSKGSTWVASFQDVVQRPVAQLWLPARALLTSSSMNPGSGPTSPTARMQNVAGQPPLFGNGRRLESEAPRENSIRLACPVVILQRLVLMRQ